MIDLLTRAEWLVFSALFLGLSVHLRWGSVDFTRLKRGGGWSFRRWRGSPREYR